MTGLNRSDVVMGERKTVPTTGRPLVSILSHGVGGLRTRLVFCEVVGVWRVLL